MELDGLVAVVTGGASGLGAAIVDGLASRGANVVYGDLRDRADTGAHDRADAGGRDRADTGAHDRADAGGRDRADGGHNPQHRVSGGADRGGARDDAGGGLWDRESEQLPGRTHFHPLDVRDPHSWQDLATKIRTTYGRLDLLVNNAGVSTRADLLSTTDDDWDRILRTNLWAPWAGIRTFIEDLTTSPRASVVNIGSIYGHLPPPPPPAPPSSVAYQVSKAGLHMLTKTAAVELAPRGIRVNAVLPGVFVTPLLQDLPAEQLRPRIERAPMARPGDPADVAAAVCYLASPQASFVTGVLLPVDGGYTAS